MIKLRLRGIVIPTNRIFIYVGSFGFVVVFIPNNVFNIGALKYIIAQFFMAKSFKGGDNVRQHLIRRGRRPRRPVALGLVVFGEHEYNCMNMIGHDYILINFNTGYIFACQQGFFNNGSDFC